MGYTASIALAAFALLLMRSVPVHGDEPYYPFETIDQYYGNKPPPPSAEQPPAPAAPPVTVIVPRKVEPLVAIKEAPYFLFPQALGFGVAVGIPDDMFYVGETFYLSRGGAWYESKSYKGPWLPAGYNRLPPELRKHSLWEIRSLRNREYRVFWKDKEKYSGRVFRPGLEDKVKPAVKKKPAAKGKPGGNGKATGNGKPAANGKPGNNGKPAGKGKPANNMKPAAKQ